MITGSNFLIKVNNISYNPFMMNTIRRVRHEGEYSADVKSIPASLDSDKFGLDNEICRSIIVATEMKMYLYCTIGSRDLYHVTADISPYDIMDDIYLEYMSTTSYILDHKSRIQKFMRYYGYECDIFSDATLMINYNQEYLSRMISESSQDSIELGRSTTISNNDCSEDIMPSKLTKNSDEYFSVSLSKGDEIDSTVSVSEIIDYKRSQSSPYAIDQYRTLIDIIINEITNEANSECPKDIYNKYSMLQSSVIYNYMTDMYKGTTDSCISTSTSYESIISLISKI